MPHLGHMSRFALQGINAAIQKYEIYMEKLTNKIPRRIAVQEFFIPYEFPINPP